MRVVFRNFTGGEVTPTLSARYDLKKAGTFLQCCRNFIPNLHGDIERRPGMRFVAQLDGPAVLLPFQFNTEPENTYVLIFSAGRIRVASPSGIVAGVELASPYALAHVYGLSIAQVGDVVYLAHKNYALRKITRSGTAPNYQWSIREVALNHSIAAPTGLAVSWKGEKEDSDTYTLNYVVTALDADGVESLPSAVKGVTGKFPTDWVVGNSVSLSWTAVAGAVEYNVYRESAGYYGFIGVARKTSFSDQNYEADTSLTPKEDWNPFTGGNHPATVAFHQQRMVLGGTKNDPASFFMSRTGDYENFRKSRPLQDDAPVEYMLASGSIDEIKWIASFGDLLIGTSGAEYKATSSGAAITPKDVQISVQSYWGSSALAPMIIGQSVMHCQRSGSHVRDLFYSWESDGYAGNDLSLLAPQLVEGCGIRQWCFQQSPGSNIWAVREDGVLLSLTYMKEQNVYGWSRHVTRGKVLSAAAISGAEGDVVLLVVEREVAGEAAYFLEMLSPRFAEAAAIEDAFFVDCGRTLESARPVEEFAGLGHLEGCDVVALADGSPVEGLKVSDGKIVLPFAARKVQAGLNYVSALAPMPLETDTQAGSTLGKRRAYGKCSLRLFRSVGGRYAASRAGDLFNADAWQGLEAYDLPFGPAVWGEACQPFSGDVEITLPSGQDADATVWIIQDRPVPFRLVALMADVDFGEN